MSWVDMRMAAPTRGDRDADWSFTQYIIGTVANSSLDDHGLGGDKNPSHFNQVCSYCKVDAGIMRQ